MFQASELTLDSAEKLLHPRSGALGRRAVLSTITGEIQFKAPKIGPGEDHGFMARSR